MNRIALPLLLLFAGCGKPQITHYTVPKDRQAGAPRPEVEWKLPEGWTQIEARVGLASFAVSGEGGKQAQVNITPLPPMQGREALIINMWRSQVGLTEIPETEALNQLSAVDVGGEPGQMFEVSNLTASKEGPQSIVTVMTHRPEASWFYKLSGDDSVVQAEKPRFIEFLKSIKIKQGSAIAPPLAHAGSGSAPMDPARASQAKFGWKIPNAWTQVAPGQMQLAKFKVPSVGGAAADVTVSVFPSDTGGQLANVNRWRGQIGLGPVDAAEMSKLVAPLDPPGGDAILVDMSNNSRQLIGAIVRRGTQWFFYKLLGDAAAVAPQKKEFVEFVKSEP